MELTASANNSKRGRIFRNIDLVCALCFSSWLCKRCFLYFMVRALIGVFQPSIISWT